MQGRMELILRVMSAEREGRIGLVGDSWGPLVVGPSHE